MICEESKIIVYICIDLDVILHFAIFVELDRVQGPIYNFNIVGAEW